MTKTAVTNATGVTTEADANRCGPKGGMNVVRKETFQKWEREARTQGWELVRKVDGKCAEYRHLRKVNGEPCGAIQVVVASCMRKDTVRCGGCQDPLIEWMASAKSRGWELVRRAAKAGYGEYRHILKANGEPCGTVQVVQATNMRNGTVRCGGCQDPLIEWAASAQAQGWELVRKEDGRRAEYRHLRKANGEPCGTVQVVQATNMRNGTVRCGGCQDPLIEWAASAQAQGWELIRRAEKADYAEYRHLRKANGEPCGAIQVVVASSMRKGTVRCGGCQDPILEWEASAQAQGWELVRKVDGRRAEYRHLRKANGEPCGAIQVVIAFGMRKGTAHCVACHRPGPMMATAPYPEAERIRNYRAGYLGRWIDEAAAHGWELVGKVDGTHGEFRHLLKANGEPCGTVQVVQATNMRKGTVRCGGCQDPSIEWAASAQAQGWELIRRAAKAGYGEYQHLQKEDGSLCGTVQVAHIAHMRKGTVRCGGCQDPLIEWRASAQAHGWELVRKAEKASCGEYRHLRKVNGEPCGAVQIVAAASMRNGAVRCGGCQDPFLEWMASAKAQGWELIRKVDGKRAEYRHLQNIDGDPCGAVQVATADNMRRGAVRCGGCQDPLIEWMASAKAQGWELVRKAEKVGYAEYRHLQKDDGNFCGTVQMVHAAHMRKGTVRCGGCQDPLIEWRASAQVQGWELVRKVDRSYAEYIHLLKTNGDPCGAVQIVAAASMRNGAVRCGGCQDPLIEWEASAKVHGWELVRKVDGARAEYRHLLKVDGTPCGAVQVVAAAGMRSGTVRCETCGDPLVSVLHQRVRGLLSSMAIEGVDFKEEIRMGMKPALVDGGDDGIARADFGVTVGRIRIVLEIDGQQHFTYTSHWHEAEIDFKRQVFRDVFVEMDAADQRMTVLRFGSWEDITTIEAVLHETIRGERKDHRLAEDLPLAGFAVHPEFWSWRDEARKDYRNRIEAPSKPEDDVDSV